MTEPSASLRTFPENFVWGAATAGHQIEGSNVNSDLWFLENLKPTTFVDRSGDACDSYHRYAEDIAMLAGFGLSCYRFSIEWSRIEPSPGHFSNAELDYYQRVIECCHDHGITPAVTFNHCTTPRWFAEAGGWLTSTAGELFGRFCDRAASRLADGMAYAFTLNEPQLRQVFRAIPGAGAYFSSQDPVTQEVHDDAARRLGVKRFVTSDYPAHDEMTPQLIAAHEQGYAAIKAARSDLPVGVTLSVTDFQPGGDGSPYEAVREKAYGEWLEVIRRTGDFTGVQTYRSIRLPGTGADYPPLPTLPFTEPDDRLAAIQRPEALGNAVSYIHSQTGKPVFVTENGLETDNDERRCWHLGESLAGLHAAIESGVPVIGYLHWSLMDNFEWARGYGPKMGLVAVDRETFTRSPKPSAALLGSIAKRNAL